MKKRIIAIVLILVLFVSFAGCNNTSSKPSTEPPTTVPPKPTAHEEFDLAVKALEAMDALTLNFSSEEQHEVWKDSFLAQNEGTLILEGIGGELIAQAEGSMRFNNEAALKYTELYTGGTSYVTFDDTKFRKETTAEDYLKTQYPIVLFDAAHFEKGSREELANGLRLRFTDATELEEWVAPDYAKLTEVTAEMVIGPNGVESMTYTASFRQGASDMQISVETSVAKSTEALTAEKPADSDSFIEAPYTWVPQVMARAISNYNNSKAVTFTTSQIISSQAAGVVEMFYSDLSVYKAGSTPYFSHNVDVTYTDGKEQETVEYSEILIDDKLTYTYNGEAETYTPSIPSVKSALETMLTEYLPQASYMTSAEVTPAGEGILLEMGLETEDAIKKYRQLAGKEITGELTTLDDLASDYKNNKLTGYMGIDPDTWLPTSFGIDFEGVHTIEGYECILSQQYSGKIFAADPDAYSKITEEPMEEEEPEKPATPLFYHVTGEDGSEMWLLGTIHIGDERTAFLPQEIYDAFDASDALAVEFNLNAHDEDMEEDEEYQENITEYYFYTDQSTVEDHLDAEVYEAAVTMLKYTGDYNANMPYIKPFVWENMISNAHYIEGRRLFSDKGVDQRLLDRAEEQGKEILDVESAESQLGMFSGFSDELQEYLLKSTLSSSRSEYNNAVYELFELWCSGDEEALIAYLRDEDEEDSEEMTEEEKKLYEEYQTAMQTDRDIDMVAVAKDYLSSGKTVFYAVGLAHLLSENGLVDSLRAAGYTVELVQFTK